MYLGLTTWGWITYGEVYPWRFFLPQQPLALHLGVEPCEIPFVHTDISICVVLGKFYSGNSIVHMSWLYLPCPIQKVLSSMRQFKTAPYDKESDGSGLKFCLCHESFPKTIDIRGQVSFHWQMGDLAWREVKKCARTSQFSTTDQEFQPTNTWLSITWDLF